LFTWFRYDETARKDTTMTDTIWPREGELVQGWFAIDEPSPGVVRIQEPLHDENVKSFLVLGTERAVLIDTGMGVGDIGGVVASLTDLPVTVINSHAHWDHIGGNEHFDEIWIHEAEAEGIVNGVPNDVLRPWFQPDRLRGPLPPEVSADSISYPPTPATGTLEGGEEIDLGDRCLEVIHCPGHSPGGIALWDEGNRILFTTDVAYPCTLYVYKRDDLPVYLATFDRLLTLDPQPLAIYGSHCDVEMPVAMLAAQRDAIAAIIGGLAPTRELPDGVLRWELAGFALELG
jgi:glyoxylase-like metal-dependent hydrolase (beta-lactamase superfamily II)